LIQTTHKTPAVGPRRLTSLSDPHSLLLSGISFMLEHPTPLYFRRLTDITRQHPPEHTHRDAIQKKRQIKFSYHICSIFTFNSPSDICHSWSDTPLKVSSVSLLTPVLLQKKLSASIQKCSGSSLI